MPRFKKSLMVGVVLGILAVSPIVALAQFNIDTSYSLPNELGVEVIPNYPRPNELVFFILTLYTDDLDSADISWYQNDKLTFSGKGATRHSFRLGKVGEETKVEIRVKLLSGPSFSKTFTLNPASVDLVWEANSYVPPFYQGKALHSRQGSIKIIAMPEFVKNGRRISPQNLIYKWSNSVEAYQSQSGYGKNVIILNGSILGRDDEIEVLVTDPVNNLVGNGFITISPTDPEVLFYENSPYYGHLFDRAISSFELKTAEAQVLAAPYYFSKESNGGLSYDWQLNGFSIPELINSRTAIFKKPEGLSGQSNIFLRVNNNNRVLQEGEASLIMQFEE